VRCKKSGLIFLPFCHNSRVVQTDRQTDRQTGGRTEFSSLDRVCISCSAVKKCEKLHKWVKSSQHSLHFSRWPIYGPKFANFWQSIGRPFVVLMIFLPRCRMRILSVHVSCMSVCQTRHTCGL